MGGMVSGTVSGRGDARVQYLERVSVKSYLTISSPAAQGPAGAEHLRTNSVCAVIYYAIGVFVSYTMMGSYVWGAASALLFSALLLPLLWVPVREGRRLDAQGWTFSSTKGTTAFVVMIMSWFPQLWLLDFTTSVINSLILSSQGRH